jgi:hypothetical protein
MADMQCSTVCDWIVARFVKAWCRGLLLKIRLGHLSCDSGHRQVPRSGGVTAQRPCDLAIAP